MPEIKHISDLSLGEVTKLINDAYKDGWESDDGFLLATQVKGD